MPGECLVPHWRLHSSTEAERHISLQIVMRVKGVSMAHFWILIKCRSQADPDFDFLSQRGRWSLCVPTSLYQLFCMSTQAYKMIRSVLCSLPSFSFPALCSSINLMQFYASAILWLDTKKSKESKFLMEFKIF